MGQDRGWTQTWDEASNSCPRAGMGLFSPKPKSEVTAACLGTRALADSIPASLCCWQVSFSPAAHGLAPARVFVCVLVNQPKLVARRAALLILKVFQPENLPLPPVSSRRPLRCFRHLANFTDQAASPVQKKKKKGG